MSLVIVFKEELNDSNVKTMTTFLIDKERMNKTLAKGFVQRSGLERSGLGDVLAFIMSSPEPKPNKITDDEGRNKS